MNRYLISIITMLTVFSITPVTFAQDEETPGQRVQRQRENMRQRIQNMSDAKREKFLAELQKRREQYPNMSEEEKEKFRAEMRKRFGQRYGISPVEQLEAISEIEKQVEKLKTAILIIEASNQEQSKDLSKEDRDKLKEKITKANRERLSAISAIETQVAKLKGRGRRPQSVSQRRSGRLDRPQRPVRDSLSSSRRAPDFELSSFDGKTVRLSDQRGKIVVLEWFNMECPFSKYHYETKNTMTQLAKKYKDKNVVCFAVNSTNHTTRDANIKFAQKHKLPYPILDDRSGKVGRTYGAKTTPHIFVINPRGRIVYDGAIDNSPLGNKKEGIVNYVDNVLAELTTGKPVSTRSTKSYGCSVKYAAK